MADSFYTSYSTSVALRAAGAPQGDYTDAECYYCSACGRGYLGTPENGWRRLDSPEEWCGCGVHRTHARAFRADEIIEALGHRFGGASVYRSNLGEVWTIELKGKTLRTSGPFVEALAATWLAVLKEGK
jgi:hypothetical protein